MQVRYQFDLLSPMKLKEIEKEAVTLSEAERADLVCKLLDTLPPPDTDVSDEEVLERERKMDCGAVEPLSHEEFVRRVRKQRGK